MKQKVFVFGIGDKRKLNHLLKETRVDGHVGPSQSEHDFLMSKSPYYRISYDLGKYSFCSDVGRFGMLSLHKGLYIDVSVEIGNDFVDFIDKISLNKAAAFRGNTRIIETSVLGSGQENNEFYKGLFEIYCHENAKPGNMHFAPNILSAYIYKNGLKFTNDFNECTGNGIAVLSLLKIRDNASIKKTGAGSWGNVSKEFDYANAMKQDHGKKGEEEYRQNVVSEANVKKFNNVLKYGYYEPDIWMLRNIYESSKKKYLRTIIKDYKKKKSKTKFGDKLVGSILYRFLTFKK